MIFQRLCTQLVLILFVLFLPFLPSFLPSVLPPSPPLLLPLPPLPKKLDEGPPRRPALRHIPLLGGARGRVGGYVGPRLLLVDLPSDVVVLGLRLLDFPAQVPFPNPAAKEGHHVSKTKPSFNIHCPMGWCIRNFGV